MTARKDAPRPVRSVRPAPRRGRRLLAALAIVFLVVVGSASAASAHAQLEGSNPADGAKLASSPPKVTLTFSESVQVNLGGVRVFDADGKRVDAGNSRRDGADDVVSVGLDDGLPNGTYIVTWRVVSGDSHPVHGGFLFSVRSESQVASGLVDSLLDTSGDQVWQIVGAVLRIVAYCGLLLAGGGAVLLSLIGSEEDRRRLAPPLSVAAVVGAVAVLLGLPIQATLATGLGAGAITRPGVLSQVLEAGVGTSLLAAVVGAAILVAALRRIPGPVTWSATLVGGAMAVGSFALAGHNRATSPEWLVTVVDLAHLYAGSVWFGGLVVLGAVLARRRSDADPGGAASAVARFSSIASIALTTVAVAGFALGWFEVRAIRALTSTTYGQLLMVKVGVVALVVLAGTYNHFRLVPVVARMDHDDARWSVLRRTVRMEAVGIAVVLALTGVLVNVTPARTAAGIGTVGSFSAPLGDGSVNLTIDPNRAGVNTIHIYLLDRVGRQIDPAQTLDLQFRQAARDIGPIDRQPVKAGPGHWQYDGDVLSLSGQWQVDVVARVSEFDEERATIDLKVNP